MADPADPGSAADGAVPAGVPPLAAGSSPPAGPGPPPPPARPWRQSAERRRGLALIAVLLIVAGGTSALSGAVTVHEFGGRIAGNDAGCGRLANCTDNGANEVRAYQWGVVTVVVGAALVAVGAALLARLWWTGPGGRARRRPREGPRSPG